ncbi:hypothetical protein C922_03563 [Plasmodium inui San Antonio 1]|uniref:ADF-H domain-containing protein n=1 Tax=Plasmodium inui San Antonio 1 TaxID=1237626 RepID=W7A483_9APIC|nr:hypothetical protein C922_03563 [Plasmodium inui San Antonio 1]EUD66093.1 hypothetical protein C922_03563 [Plasmodium inui San Antonio 1]
MKANLSPSLRQEIALCNKQKSNKRCILISLNSKCNERIYEGKGGKAERQNGGAGAENESGAHWIQDMHSSCQGESYHPIAATGVQFTLEGYTEQRENPSDDLESIKCLLNDELAFILYNAAVFTARYRWVLILWVPDESVATELGRQNESAEKVVREKKYTKVTQLNRLIYCNLKNNLLYYVDHDRDVPFHEVHNFEQLERCIRGSLGKCLTVGSATQMCKARVLSHFSVTNYLHNYYFLNEQMKQCCDGLNDEGDGLCNDLDLLAKERNTCIVLLTIDVEKYKLESRFQKIETIESFLHLTKELHILYVLYKTSDTYTCFYLCHSDRCTTKEKFVYSLFKPHLIQILKKKHIPIFLSVEMGKLKHLVDFIRGDITTKKEVPIKNAPLDMAPKTKKSTTHLAFVSKKNYPSHAQISGTKEFLPIVENDSISRKGKTNDQSGNGPNMHKKHSFTSRPMNLLSLKRRESKSNNTHTEQPTSGKTNKMAHAPLGEGKQTSNSTCMSENIGPKLLKKWSLSKSYNLKKKTSLTNEGGKNFTVRKKREPSPTLLQSKSLTLRKGSSTSVQLKKLSSLSKQKSLQLDKKKSLTRRLKGRSGTSEK